jgi:hypothetical protein
MHYINSLESLRIKTVTTKAHIFFTLIVFQVLLPGFVLADEEQFTAVWDTVVAEIQIIESLNQPDSVKSALMVDLFQRYNLTEKDYRSFYDHFSNLSPEDQRKFMERVKAVLPSLLKLGGEYQTSQPQKQTRIPVKKKE